MDYLQLWKDGWNYYKQHPSFALPYLLLFVLVMGVGAILPSVFKSMASGIVGGPLSTTLRLLAPILAIALAMELIARFFTGWVLEMIKLADAGEEVRLKSSFASYKGKTGSFIGAGLLRDAIIFLIPALVVLFSLLLALPSFSSLSNIAVGQLTSNTISSLVKLIFSPFVLLVGVLSLIYIVIASFLLLFVDQSVIVSEKNIFAAIKSSFKFVKGNFASILLFLIIYAVIALTLFLPPLLLFSGLGGLLVKLTGINLFSSITSLLSSLYAYLIAPLLLAVLTVFFIRRQQE